MSGMPGAPDLPPLGHMAVVIDTDAANEIDDACAIAARIVVVWTSGYPGHAPWVNDHLKLEQGLRASAPGRRPPLDR